eukprot:5959062-Alexandrium_andersonii.AAC.1
MFRQLRARRAALETEHARNRLTPPKVALGIFRQTRAAQQRCVHQALYMGRCPGDGEDTVALPHCGASERPPGQQPAWPLTATIATDSSGMTS